MNTNFVAIDGSSESDHRLSGASISRVVAVVVLVSVGAFAVLYSTGAILPKPIATDLPGLVFAKIQKLSNSLPPQGHNDIASSNVEPTPTYLHSDCKAKDLADHEVLGWLRSQPFNQETEKALAEHPMVLAAQEGNMPLLAVRLVLLEEYSIETTDLRSMAAALARHGSHAAARSFFLSSTESEAIARKKLVKMAEMLGMTLAKLQAYEPMPTAHAYTAYLGELANFGGMGAVAAGFAVNFPAWGRMCGRIGNALQSHYNFSASDVSFFSYFAEPLGPDYDASATAVIAAGRSDGETLCDIERGVRLLQSYERMFWDSVWAASIGKHYVSEPLHI